MRHRYRAELAFQVNCRRRLNTEWWEVAVERGCNGRVSSRPLPVFLSYSVSQKFHAKTIIISAQTAVSVLFFLSLLLETEEALRDQLWTLSMAYRSLSCNGAPSQLFVSFFVFKQYTDSEIVSSYCKALDLWGQTASTHWQNVQPLDNRRSQSICCIGRIVAEALTSRTVKCSFSLKHHFHRQNHRFALAAHVEMWHFPAAGSNNLIVINCTEMGPLAIKMY